MGKVENTNASLYGENLFIDNINHGDCKIYLTKSYIKESSKDGAHHIPISDTWYITINNKSSFNFNNETLYDIECDMINKKFKGQGKIYGNKITGIGTYILI